MRVYRAMSLQEFVGSDMSSLEPRKDGTQETNDVMTDMAHHDMPS